MYEKLISKFKSRSNEGLHSEHQETLLTYIFIQELFSLLGLYRQAHEGVDALIPIETSLTKGRRYCTGPCPDGNGDKRYSYSSIGLGAGELSEIY